MNEATETGRFKTDDLYSQVAWKRHTKNKFFLVAEPLRSGLITVCSFCCKRELARKSYFLRSYHRSQGTRGKGTGTKLKLKEVLLRIKARKCNILGKEGKEVFYLGPEGAKWSWRSAPKTLAPRVLFYDILRAR